MWADFASGMGVAWAARILAEGEEGQTDWREPDGGKGSKMEREGAQALGRAAVAAGAVGEGGEEQEAAGGEGVAPGAGDGHVGEAAGWTTSSANGAGAASSVITSISTSMTRCANCRLV